MTDEPQEPVEEEAAPESEEPADPLARRRSPRGVKEIQARLKAQTRKLKGRFG